MLHYEWRGKCFGCVDKRLLGYGAGWWGAVIFKWHDRVCSALTCVDMQSLFTCQETCVRYEQDLQAQCVNTHTHLHVCAIVQSSVDTEVMMPQRFLSLSSRSPPFVLYSPTLGK